MSSLFISESKPLKINIAGAITKVKRAFHTNIESISIAH
jgi:hypothetical protein